MSYAVSSMNKVILIGRLGQDPELKEFDNGNMAKFSIATSEKWKNKDSGNQEEKTEWHNIVVWGKTAEFAGEWLKKGQLVSIEGKLQTRSWESDGVKKYMTEIVADTITMLGGKGDVQESPTQVYNNTNNFTEEDEDDLPF